MTARSRYRDVEVSHATVADGQGGTREVAYLLSRAAPTPAQPMAWHRVAPDDRLDLIAAAHLGDPQAFWLICDANGALDPDALLGPDREGALLVIPVPGV